MNGQLRISVVKHPMFVSDLLGKDLCDIAVFRGSKPQAFYDMLTEGPLFTGNTEYYCRLYFKPAVYDPFFGFVLESTTHAERVTDESMDCVQFFIKQDARRVIMLLEQTLPLKSIEVK